MDRKIKIARKLVRIARSLMASGFSEYEKDRWWYAGDRTSDVINSLRNQYTKNRNGNYQFFLNENREFASVSCNIEVKESNGTITMRAFNFWESHYDDQNYGEWVDNMYSASDLGIGGFEPVSFTRTSDEDTASRIQAYADDARASLAAAADELEQLACPPFK